MNRCRPYRFVHPLRGCVNTRGNAIGYRDASPDGDGFPVTYFVTHSHTDHSSLITVHSSHTFSAKERDTETGLSYFGARYYSRDLSIWLSVDPMSDKYPSTSPYAYCRNSPIILVDPNGMFDDEAKAIRLRNRAAKRYGEDRVSDVFNNTIDGGKANYAFSIYGKGKTKRSYSGGTNEFGGPVITCDKADKVVFSKKDYKSYAKSQRGRFEMGFSMSVGAQYGAGLHIGEQATGISIMGNIASIDLIGGSFFSFSVSAAVLIGVRVDIKYHR